MDAYRPSERRWAQSFENIRREHGFEPLRIEGAIPAELRGSFYRNGPGLVELLGRRYDHWFDGDGVVNAIRFDGGAAEGSVRLLRTNGLTEERRRGAPYFGAYGTKTPGFWNPWRAYRFAAGTSKNPANTSVLGWAGRLLALCEIGRPFEVDPETLESLGETDLGGTVERTFSAHPRHVATNDCYFNIGTRLGHPKAIDLFALRPEGTTNRLAQIPLGIDTLIHDFAATPRYLIVFVHPLELRLLNVLLGIQSFDHALQWKPRRGTEVLVIPLDAPASAKRFSVDPFWSWHIANAFEDGDKLVIDMVRYRDFASTNDWLCEIIDGRVDADADGYLGRATLDPAREWLSFDQLCERTGEFPRVAPSRDGLRHRTIYWTEHSSPEVGHYGPPDSVVRLDTESGDRDVFQFTRGHAPSEMVYIPHPARWGESEGWAITQVYDPDEHSTYWALFDASHLSDGPIATAHLDHHLPLGFHGAWVPRA